MEHASHQKPEKAFERTKGPTPGPGHGNPKVCQKHTGTCGNKPWTSASCDLTCRASCGFPWEGGTPILLNHGDGCTTLTPTLSITAPQKDGPSLHPEDPFPEPDASANKQEPWSPPCHQDPTQPMSDPCVTQPTVWCSHPWHAAELPSTNNQSQHHPTTCRMQWIKLTRPQPGHWRM